MRSNIVSLDLYDSNKKESSDFPNFHRGGSEYNTFFSNADGKISVINNGIREFYNSINIVNLPYRFDIMHTVSNEIKVDKIYFPSSVNVITMKKEYLDIEKFISYNCPIRNCEFCLSYSWIGDLTMEDFFVNVSRRIDKIAERQNKMYSEYLGTIGSYNI
jgi:hypothetical protein